MNERILQFVNYVKINIIDLAEKELENIEKKAKLDKAVTAYFVSLLSTAKLGFFSRFVIEKVVVKNIPTITQAIYDLLKAKVKGITK